MKLVDFEPHKTFMIEDADMTLELLNDPSENSRRLRLIVRTKKLVDIAQAHIRVPSWLRLAKALQGIE